MIDKSCAANNYFVVFTICENETTIFPGLTHSNNEPHDCHSLFTDGVPLDVSHVRVLDATHIATLIVSVLSCMDFYLHLPLDVCYSIYCYETEGYKLGFLATSCISIV